MNSGTIVLPPYYARSIVSSVKRDCGEYMVKQFPDSDMFWDCSCGASVENASEGRGLRIITTSAPVDTRSAK